MGSHDGAVKAEDGYCYVTYGLYIMSYIRLKFSKFLQASLWSGASIWRHTASEKNWREFCATPLSRSKPTTRPLSGNKCQTPLHGRTPTTDMLYNTTKDKLTTILQLVVQQIHHQRTKTCHIAMPEPNISTCQDVWNVANFCPLAVNLLYDKLYRIVVNSSVGVLYNMSVAGKMLYNKFSRL